MKNILLFLLAASISHSYAQDRKVSELAVIELPRNLSLHFLSPEPIQYVDISQKNIIGDLPLKNVLRLKLKDSVQHADAIVTITGQKYIAQYHIVSCDSGRNAVTEIDINPADMKPLDISGIGLSQPQLKNLAINLFCKKQNHSVTSAQAFGLKANLFHVYSAGDYVLLSLGYENNSNLKYDIDELRFKIEDKKITKATNVQSLEIKPEFILFDQPAFRHSYRNIVVFKKISFPGNKVLNIELSEKQISGRVITLSVSYKDILEADTINL
ncbi:DUF4138 domain-containing protein [Mucilaginibacter corticis]|uniref:DUF4138 domain-containing protein n=1 Tax=Mucilaginibacter corticis TaxID=2597670 RepID=A0A556MM06_9SPHI|nr:DUF4138 domain-containing protein [Mucilaginibacter corticis]TSJ40940.1 DUF4138 domain-containing protein [Mucilaginibacter corticis]